MNDCRQCVPRSNRWRCTPASCMSQSAAFGPRTSFGAHATFYDNTYLYLHELFGQK